MVHIKQFAYQAWQNFALLLFRMAGGRPERAMGLSFTLHPDTVWPGRRGLMLPEGGCRSKIVAYADLVQAHAVCDYVSRLPHGPVIIDVGAHHGAYALLLGALVKSRRGVVVAIEPEPRNAAILRSNIQRNALADVVCIQECAVSETSGRTQLFSRGSESGLFADKGMASPGCSEVKVFTLQDIVQELAIQKVDLLLIDVEGAELLVLKGFPWDKMKPAMILCELHPYNWQEFGYTGEDMSAFMHERHYRCLDMYLRHHTSFHDIGYIGPCLFMPD